MSMSRHSQTETAYVQSFVRSNYFMRSSCVQKSSCPDFRAFKIAYVQTSVRFKGKLVRTKTDNLCVYVQTIVRSNTLCPDFGALKIAYVQVSCVPKENSCAPKLIFCAFMSRLSCVQKTLCPDFRAFKIAYVQFFVCSKPKIVCCKIDILCVFFEAILFSKILMSRLACVQNCLCSDFRAFQWKIRALQNW